MELDIDGSGTLTLDELKRGWCRPVCKLSYTPQIRVGSVWSSD